MSSVLSGGLLVAGREKLCHICAVDQVRSTWNEAMLTGEYRMPIWVFLYAPQKNTRSPKN
jgi:hypothetical protein